MLNKHKKRDSWFLDDYSVNPYKGCSCNCLYCYVRGSKYGENMEEGMFVKENALAVLEKQLASRAKRNQYGFVMVGSGTDAYIHHEKEWKITEGILRLLLKYRFPVFISTKCDLITRDIELLKEIDKAAILPADLKGAFNHGVILAVSVSTMDEKIASILEPGAISPLLRLQLVHQLKKHGFFAGVNAIPLLPFVSDTADETEKMISAASISEADFILVGGLTLFGSARTDSKTLYYRFLQKFNPALISAYDQLYGDNFYLQRQYQQELKQKAEQICDKYGISTSIIK